MKLVNKMLQLVYKDHEWLTTQIMPIASEITRTNLLPLDPKPFVTKISTLKAEPWAFKPPP